MVGKDAKVQQIIDGKYHWNGLVMGNTSNFAVSSSKRVSRCVDCS